MAIRVPFSTRILFFLIRKLYPIPLRDLQEVLWVDGKDRLPYLFGLIETRMEVVPLRERLWKNVTDYFGGAEPIHLNEEESVIEKTRYITGLAPDWSTYGEFLSYCADKDEEGSWEQLEKLTELVQKKRHISKYDAYLLVRLIYNCTEESIRN